MEKILMNVKEMINSPSALTREQGKIIYDCIILNFELGNEVELDFSEVESLITPFLNVAIGKLYEDYTSEVLQTQLKLKNVPEGKSASFKLVIDNAKRYYSNKDKFDGVVKEVLGT